MSQADLPDTPKALGIVPTMGKLCGHPIELRALYRAMISEKYSEKGAHSTLLFRQR
ncbi:MAG: hypothetical protein WKF84_20585 [Pyrinomonadaceae bacterium]